MSVHVAMSLTQEINDAESPVRLFLERVTELGPAKGSSANAKRVRERLGFHHAVGARTVIKAPGSRVDAATVGTAFDCFVQVQLGQFDTKNNAAHDGVAVLQSAAPGTHETHILAGAVDMAMRKIHYGWDLERACVVVAWAESFMWAKTQQVFLDILSGTLGDRLRRSPTAERFFDDIDHTIVENMKSLRHHNEDQIDEWVAAIRAGAEYVGNPMFSGAELVDGADGDWVIGDTLVECKTYGEVTNTHVRTWLLQLMGYVLLDTDDDYGLNKVGVFLPRQKTYLTWNISDVIRGGVGDLSELRAQFKDVMDQRDTAVAVAETDESWIRRRRLMLADNKVTPYTMLEELARSEDHLMRAKVARNSSTPLDLLTELADDRRANVREAVAGNPSTPEGVRQVLRKDRSKAVRAKANTTKPLAELRERGAEVSGLRDRGSFTSRWGGVYDLMWLENVNRPFAWGYAEVLLDGMSTVMLCLWYRGQIPRGYPGYDRDGTHHAVEQRKQADQAEKYGLSEASTPPEQHDTGVVMVIDYSGFLASRQRTDEAMRRRAESTDPAVVDQLVDSALPSTRRSAARHEALNRDQLIRLMSDRRAEVRETLARNRSVPSEVLGLMSGERSVMVRREVAGNLQTPAPSLGMLAHDSDLAVRQSVAANMSTAPVDLRGLLHSMDLRTVLNAVINPATDIADLASMRLDPDPVVAKAARTVHEFRVEFGHADREDSAQTSHDELEE